MSCSKEEIEGKRRAALEKIRSRGSKCKFEPYDRNQSGAFARTSCEKPIRSLPSKVVTATAYLVSSERFEVKPSEYSDPLISVFKTIPSKTYDYAKRLWNFSVQHYELLHERLAPLRPDVVVGAIPQYVLNVVREPENKKHVDLSRIESTLRNKLMPFQVEGVRFGIEKKGRCMIADDMGLGKTFQALAIVDYYKEDWPLLIVTTSSMRETWENKIQELLPSIPLASIVCVSSGKEKLFLTEKQANIIIVSYKMTTICTNLLIEKKFGAVILDESHLLKSYKAQSTECVMKITKHANRIILLSGTPALSRPSELYTQLQMIEPKFFQGFIEFGKRYCDGKQTNFGWDMMGQSNLTELQILLEKRFLIRRTKEQVLSHLKDKTRESVILDSSLLALSQKTREGLSQLARSYTKKNSSDKHAALLTFFSESAKVKIPAVCKYVSDVIKENEKFLVFAHHKNVLEAICRTLDECRVNYISIDGSTKTDYRSVLVDKFQLSDSCRCAVLSITAANAGITLTAAQLVLFAELHWNPGILVQAEARAHRIGQENGVHVKYLIAKGTSDDFMWPMLEGKLNVLNKVGLSKDTFTNATLSKQISTHPCIEDYFSQSNEANSFIAGTNIKEKDEFSMDCSNNTSCNNSFQIEDTFLEDEEGDKLLLSLNFS